MMILLIIISVITSAYVLFMFSLSLGLVRLSKQKNKEDLADISGISLIVCFRNEQQHLPLLLKSIQSQETLSMPLEVIFVDDHSEDAGPEIIEGFMKQQKNIRIQLIRLSEMENLKGKKAAQRAGVEAATHDVIAFTDADCVFPLQWLKNMSGFLQTGIRLVCGPVEYAPATTLREKLFQAEFLSLILSGAGAFGIHKPIFCNGANMLLRRSTFLDIADSMEGTRHASGDDVFLLHAILKKCGTGSVAFAAKRDCIVSTPPPHSFGGFFTQRIRWASKSVSYTNSMAIFTAIIVYLMSAGIFLLLIAGMFNSDYLWAALIAIGVKSLTDAFLFRCGLYLHQQPWLPLLSIPLQVLYIPYISLTGVFSLLFKRKWKGRS